jgi:hypothetical protein
VSGVPKERDSVSPVSVVLQVLAASAGLAALTTFVGGAMLWIRVHALGLPADQAVALLPERLLLIVGAHALIGPVSAGLVALVILVLIGPLNDDGTPRPRLWVALGVLSSMALITVLALVWDLDLFPEQVAMVVAALFGFVIVALTARSPYTRSRHIALVVFAVFSLWGGLLAVLRTSGFPRMEPIGVLLKDTPRSVAGFFIGRTADRLYVATLPVNGDPGDPFADAEIDRVLEIPREEVLRVATRSPVGIRPEEPGRQQAHSLLSELTAQYTIQADGAAGDDAVVTVDPVVAFAPLVHLHSREFAWPMSAEEFLRNSSLAWAHDDNCPDHSPTLGGQVGAQSRAGPPNRGRLRPERLRGEGAYAHVQAGRNCRDVARASFSASDHTRPYDQRRRPEGLGLEEGFYLDLANDKRSGKKRVAHPAGQSQFGGVPTYYERHDEEVDGRPGLRITYWLFYGLSQPPGPSRLTAAIVHEGDWERISVLLHVQSPDSYLPVSVRYHFHDASRDVPWRTVQRAGSEAGGPPTHPVVYSARGSHASYPRAGRYEQVFVAGGRRRFAVYDEAIACPRCPEWRTWELSTDATTQPWYGFGGAWGRVGDMGGTTGPLGPSKYKTSGLGAAPERTLRRPAPVATGGGGVP